MLEAYDLLLRQVESLKAELACAQAFHDVAVKERDLARIQVAHARTVNSMKANSEQAGRDVVAYIAKSRRLNATVDGVATGEGIVGHDGDFIVWGCVVRDGADVGFVCLVRYDPAITLYEFRSPKEWRPVTRGSSTT